jgi:O-antigen/teichoic acid export membrane protein
MRPDGSTAVLVRGRRSLTLVQTIASLGAIQVVAMCFQLVRAKVAAVTLGPDGVGVISLIDQVAGLVAQLCTFSLPFAAMKFLSAAHSEGQHAFAKLYVAFLRLLLAVSLAGAACGSAVLIWWPSVLGDELVGYAEIAVLALLAVPAMNLIALLTNTMAAAQRVHAAAAYGAYSAAAIAVLCTLGVLLDGLRGYYVGALITPAAVVLAGVWYLYSREKLSIFGHHISLWREIRQRPDVISFATSLYLISFAMPVVYLIARYAVLYSHGLEATGLLQSAMALSLALTMVMRQANMLYLTPAMNRVANAEDKFRAAAEYMRAFSLVIAMAAVPLVLFPDWWLPLLYSSRFLAAAPYVYLFVLAQTLELLAGVVLALLIGLGHIATQLWVTLSGLAGLALIACALAPRYGIAGVGLAILFDGLAVFVLAAWRLWMLHRFPIAQAVGWLPAGVVLLIASCGILAVRFPSNTPASILIKGAICLFLALAGLKILRDRDSSFARL